MQNPNFQYIEAPNYAEIKNPSIFLGGGISHVKVDWQDKLKKQLEHLPITVVNPRRKSFDTSKKDESALQVNWEFKYLRLVDVLIFYFCEETLCPITLFELGGALERRKCAAVHYPTATQDIIVYCQDKYERKWDVEYQIKLMNGESWNDAAPITVYDNYKLFLNAIEQRFTDL